MGDSVPFGGRRATADAHAKTNDAPSGPLDDEQPKARGLYQAVQRKSDGGALDAGDPGAIAATGTQGTGAALPHYNRIQAAFGRHDVSHVRAHTDDRAASASRALGASAYAQGDRVAFAGSPDLHTAAHEAAHTVQQRRGAHVPGGIDTGAGDPLEKHADAVADRVVSGESAEHLLDASGGGGAAGTSAPVQRKAISSAPTPDAQRAQHDWQTHKLAGNPKAILAAVHTNQGSPLYIAAIASHVGNGDSHWPAAQKNDPLWQQAKADAKQVSGAEKSTNGGNPELEGEALHQLAAQDPVATDQMIAQLRQGKEGKQLTLGDVAKQGSNDPLVAAGLGQALAHAEEDGVVDAGAIATDKRQGFQGPNGVAAIDVAYLDTDVEGPRNKLASATATVASLDNRLGLELSQIGPTLTFPQQQAYAAKFYLMKEYKDAVTARNAAATALDATLAKDNKALTAFADKGDPTLRGRAQGELLSSNQTLAASSRAGATTALLWADTVIKDPAFGSNRAAVQKIVDAATNTLLTNLTGELQGLLRPSKDKGAWTQQVKSAVARVDTEYLQPFEKCKNVVDLKNVPAMINKFQVIWKLNKGDVTDAKVVSFLKDLTAEAATADSWGKRVFTVLIDGIGASATALDPAIAKNTKEVLSHASELVDASRSLLEDLKVLKPGEAVTPEVSELAKTVAERGSGLSRLLPGVGLVASAYATGVDWENVKRTGSPAAIAMLAGDAISTIGASIEMLPIPGVDLIGGAISIVGVAISALASVFAGGGPSQEQKDEQKLLGPGSDGDKGINAYSPALIKTFTDGSAPANLKVAEAAGLTPDDIQKLAAKSPDMFKSDNAVAGLLNAQKALARGVVVRSVKTQDGAPISKPVYTRYVLRKMSPLQFLQEFVRGGKDPDAASNLGGTLDTSDPVLMPTTEDPPGQARSGVMIGVVQTFLGSAVFGTNDAIKPGIALGNFTKQKASG